MATILRSTLAASAALFLVAASGAAQAHTLINFDDLAAGTIVTNQYAGVTFSSNAGEVVETTSQPLYQISQPNFICTFSTGNDIDCTQSVNLAFAAPVDNLKFVYTGENTPGSTFNIDVYQNFGANPTSVTIVGVNQQLHDAAGVDLSVFQNITRISINQVADPFGLGYDDFSFDPGQAAGGGVPEPAAWALMIVGFGAAGAMLRRRRPIAA
ncbi:MAG TPA: PEPxxWA-CTERM sorting domain-containing protein [Phenylobacterium sp.]|jgi:hypothetical protein|uniref:PEPxxWA-CTERM sorting domain-containing protein n=1 Tax=Phenylobacterium sp. TaxID=1871053 RepID=UPI002B9563DC|nr:PEPxxWA-CTERM sorting domain-containing protein [Phenylobacterium sp.]HXA38478.1 PEPxxWA-CTERM sorting domain-containing protein [Phenylobacterium sp.]